MTSFVGPLPLGANVALEECPVAEDEVAGEIAVATSDSANATTDTLDEVIDTLAAASAPPLAALTQCENPDCTTNPNPWTNPDNPLDVSGDGIISPLDALILINAINSRGPGPLPEPTQGFDPPPYYDTSGDGYLTAIDVLMLINELNRLAANSMMAPAVPSASGSTFS